MPRRPDLPRCERNRACRGARPFSFGFTGSCRIDSEPTHTRQMRRAESRTVKTGGRAGAGCPAGPVMFATSPRATLHETIAVGDSIAPGGRQAACLVDTATICLLACFSDSPAPRRNSIRCLPWGEGRAGRIAWAPSAVPTGFGSAGGCRQPDADRMSASCRCAAFASEPEPSVDAVSGCLSGQRPVWPSRKQKVWGPGQQ